LTFARVRHRTKVTKGTGSKAAVIARAVKLIAAAEERWRAVNAVNASHLAVAAPSATRSYSIRRTERT
jgi:hypothetical protein